MSERSLTEALFPLQAVLSGLVAFRHLEGQPVTPVTDFRPRLYAVRVGYAWATELVARLRDEHAPKPGLRWLDEPQSEPESSLLALERSLADALRVSERLLELPVIDAEAFGSSCDLFLRDLARNAFFRPPDPLEVFASGDLLRSQRLTSRLQSWEGDAAKMTMVVTFGSLLLGHRFLGIADRQLGKEDGLHRAHLVIAAVRRELRTLTRFLLVEGVEAFAQQPEGTRASLEAIAKAIHGNAQPSLDFAFPEPGLKRGYVRFAEEMRAGIREARATLKAAARQLRDLGRSARIEPKTERVQKALHADVWAFRFILRAFVAKASAASVGEEAWYLDFVSEFLRHFRSFGPRLARGTGYGREEQLTRAMSALATHEAIDPARLDLATHECALFLDHLEQALAEMPEALLESFDKKQAAAELRSYLTAAKARTTAARAAAAAFGLIDAGRAQPS